MIRIEPGVVLGLARHHQVDEEGHGIALAVTRVLGQAGDPDLEGPARGPGRSAVEAVGLGHLGPALDDASGDRPRVHRPLRVGQDELCRRARVVRQVAHLHEGLRLGRELVLRVQAIEALRIDHPEVLVERKPRGPQVLRRLGVRPGLPGRAVDDRVDPAAVLGDLAARGGAPDGQEVAVLRVAVVRGEHDIDAAFRGRARRPAGPDPHPPGRVGDHAVVLAVRVAAQADVGLLPCQAHRFAASRGLGASGQDELHREVHVVLVRAPGAARLGPRAVERHLKL
jgi:hypothetical protein